MAATPRPTVPMNQPSPLQCIVAIACSACRFVAKEPKSFAAVSCCRPLEKISAGGLPLHLSTCMRTVFDKSRIADMRCIRYPPCSAFMSNRIPQFSSGFDIKISSCRAKAASLASLPRPPCGSPAPENPKGYCTEQVFFNFCNWQHVAWEGRMARCGFVANDIVRWSHISFMLPAARGTAWSSAQ